MRKISHILYSCLLLALLVFASCENDIKFKGEISEPKLVINGFIKADSIIELRVTESRFFLDTDNSPFPIVKDAVVKLYVNGEEKETLPYNDDNGFYPNSYLEVYTSTYRPKEGDEIKITASNPRFKEVSSTVFIPYAAPIVSIDTTAYKLIEVVEAADKSYYDSKKEEWVNKLDTFTYYTYDQFAMKVNFEDRGNEKNFYRIDLAVRYYYENGNTEEQSIYYNKKADFDQVHSNGEYSLVFTTSDPTFNKSTSIEEEFLGSSEISPYFDFSDILFDGKTYGLNFSTKIFKYYRIDENDPYRSPVVKRELLVNLHSISKDYYYYIRSYAAHENVNETIFTEPVQIHSNIKGGMGILGTNSTFTYTFLLP